MAAYRRWVPCSASASIQRSVAWLSPPGLIFCGRIVTRAYHRAHQSTERTGDRRPHCTSPTIARRPKQRGERGGAGQPPAAAGALDGGRRCGVPHLPGAAAARGPGVVLRPGLLRHRAPGLHPGAAPPQPTLNPKACIRVRRLGSQPSTLNPASGCPASAANHTGLQLFQGGAERRDGQGPIRDSCENGRNVTSARISPLCAFGKPCSPGCAAGWTL